MWDSQRGSRDETILTSVAESIGATLGTIAAKADTVQKGLTKRVAAAKPSARRNQRKATKGPKMRAKRAGRAKTAAVAARRRKS